MYINNNNNNGYTNVYNKHWFGLKEKQNILVSSLYL